MNKLKKLAPLAKACQRSLSILITALISIQSLAQTVKNWELETMPKNLETDFALSALPQHIRSGATVYLLDPKKGYYIARQGSNGFMCFVVRTEWERAEFRKDLATPISYDAEGTRAIFPVYADVAAMRASGRYTAMQIKDTITERFKKKVYRAPAKTGISYMLAPVMRTYDGSTSGVITMSIPHYMFYAPYAKATDIGGNSNEGGPMLLGDGTSPHEYIIIPAGATEKAKIIEDNNDLLGRLSSYKPYFKVSTGTGHH